MSTSTTPQRHEPESSRPPTIARNTSTSRNAEVWDSIRALKDLLDQQYISQEEYDERKDQLVNQLTGTRTMPKSSKPLVIKELAVPQVIPHHPPTSFAHVRAERAKVWLFDPRTGKWSESSATVKIETQPFARGALRMCYYCTMFSTPHSKEEIFVAKLSIDPFEERQTYFTDVEIQMYSKQFAELFNKYNPPKKVDFVQAYLLELVERKHSPLCGVEKYILGEYRKHNNNFGYVSEEERNTPQAFSHFTYEASDRKLLICDIQGVGDLYTDPQMHTDDNEQLSNRLMSKGNLGTRGLEKFKEVHQCNAICTYLRLPPINAKITLDGTIPVSKVMQDTRVEIISVDNKNPLPKTANEPLLGGNQIGMYTTSESPPPKASSSFNCCNLL
ncbi:eukaryotic elongation factor-2 kinase [Pelomyxa schiedti]|nr:eukaryotic elongation factor-2 kinase [Pelomyxa schiedti]